LVFVRSFTDFPGAVAHNGLTARRNKSGRKAANPTTTLPRKKTMKLKLLAVSLAAAGTLVSATALAGSTTHTLSVSATVTGNCKFNSAGPTTLTIATGAGVIDPSAAGPATGSVGVAFRCTTGTTSSISADDGLNSTGPGARRVANGGNFMPYSLTLTNAAQVGSGFGAGQDKTLTVDASITAANYQNAAAGAYADTVTLTITP